MKLPNRLSELLTLALADVAVVKDMPGYKIDMSVFHCASYATCYVCVAGACIVNQGLVSEWKERCYHPEDRWLQSRIYAISDLCFGSVSAAATEMGIEGDWKHLDREPVEYGSIGWNDYIADIVKDLKEAGL